jgi:hypothetical protein
MPDLIFTIKTPAELAGAEQAAKALESAIGKAKALGNEYGEMEKQLATARQRINEYKGTQEQATEKTKLFAQHTGELKKVAQELGREMPIVGLAIRALANPIGAALSVASIFFVTVKRHIDELNQKLDEMERAAAQPISNFAKNFREAQQEASASAGEFIATVEKIVNTIGSIGTKTDDAVKGIHRLAEAQKELVDANEARILARINLDEEQKKITPAQAIGYRQQSSMFFAQQRAAIQTTEENRTAGALAAQLGAHEIMQGRLTADAGTQGQRVNQSARVKTLAEQAANLRAISEAFGTDLVKGTGPETLFDARKKIDDAAALVEKLGSPAARLLYPSDALPNAKVKRDEAEREYEAIAAKKKLAEDVAKKSEDAGASEKNRLKSMTDAEAAAKSNAERIEKERSQLAEMREANRLAQENRQRILQTQATTGYLQSAADIHRVAPESSDAANAAARARISNTINSAALGADAILSGGRATGAQTEAIAELTKFFGLSKQSNQTILTLLGRLNDNQENFNKALQQMEHDIHYKAAQGK